MDEYQRFQTDVLNNREMQEEIKSLGHDTRTIIKYANEKGYRFTISDVEQALKGRSQLTESALEDVAGGSLNVVGGAVMDVSKQASIIIDVIASGLFIL